MYFYIIILLLTHLALSQPVHSNIRITNGTTVPQGQAPFLVMLLTQYRSRISLCGGTIIDPTTVVTAAHCIHHSNSWFYQPQDPNKIYVFYGSNQVDNRQYVHPTGYTVHPQYSPIEIHNDIAILRVPPLPMQKGKVESIPFYDKHIVPKTEMQIYGWGTTRSHGSFADNPTSLLTQRTYVSEPQNCQIIEPLYKSADGPQICTDNHYNVGADACQGDSGTGMTIWKDGRQYLAGLVSYGTNARGQATCGEDGSFGVYTNVYYYRKWIESITGNKYQCGP